MEEPHFVFPVQVPAPAPAPAPVPVPALPIIIDDNGNLVLDEDGNAYVGNWMVMA